MFYLAPPPLPARALPAILHPRIIDSTSLGATGLSSLQTLPGGRSVPGPQSEDKRSSFSDSSRRASSGGAEVLQVSNHSDALRLHVSGFQNCAFSATFEGFV